ncbi:hypothetical protein ABPG75_000365 [Micractinium tetrahymenae]
MQNKGNGQQTNTAEFNYRDGSGFTTIWMGQAIADVQATADSAPYAWPIIRLQFRGGSACACCDLCRAQPNPSSYETAYKCKAWSYRERDGACRLWTNNPFDHGGGSAPVQVGSREKCSCWSQATVPPCLGATLLMTPAAIVGDPHYQGFGQQGGRWDLFTGQAGRAYTLYTDGKGVRLDSTFGAGGPDGKATFIRALTFTRGLVRVTATLSKPGAAWVLQVTANGQPLGPMQSVRLGPAQDSIGVQAAPTKAGRPAGIIITLPYLRIRAEQRAPYKPGQLQNPNYGEWLDVYLTITGPLPGKPGGLLGSTYKPPAAGAIAGQAGIGETAALVFGP